MPFYCTWSEKTGKILDNDFNRDAAVTQSMYFEFSLYTMIMNVDLHGKLGEWVSSFLMAHQHKIGHSVPRETGTPGHVTPI